MLDGSGTFSGTRTGCTISFGVTCTTSFGTTFGVAGAGGGAGGGGGGGGGAALTNTTLIGGSGTSGTFQYCANSIAPPAMRWMMMAMGMTHQRNPRFPFLSRSISEFSNMVHLSAQDLAGTGAGCFAACAACFLRKSFPLVAHSLAAFSYSRRLAPSISIFAFSRKRRP